MCHWENGLRDVPPWSPELLVSLPSISVSGRAGAGTATENAFALVWEQWISM